LATEKKAEKRSMYVDLRDGEENDTMENWDEDKLKEVVDKKHGENDKKHPTTDIVSNLKMLLLVTYILMEYIFCFRFACFFWKLLKKVNMVGSGLVQMVPLVFIDMHYHLDLFLKRLVLQG